MKTKITVFLLPLLMMSCGNFEELTLEESNKDISEFSHVRSLDEAINIAESALSYGNPTSRGHVKLNRANAHLILGECSRSANGDTLMYAIDIDNDGGFILVSAPRNIEPIMAIIDNGSYSTNESNTNAAYIQTINSMKDYISEQSTLSSRFPTDTTIRLPIITDLAFYYDTNHVNV